MKNAIENTYCYSTNLVIATRPPKIDSFLGFLANKEKNRVAGGFLAYSKTALPPEAQKLLMKCRLLESEAPRAAALVFAHAAIDGLDDFVQLADTAKLIIGNDNDLAPRGLKKRSPSRILGQFLRVAVELVAVVLDADVQSWPAYIGPTQVLPPGDARQLAHVDRFVQYRLRKSCSAATHRKGEVQGKRGLPDRIGVLADEVKVAKGAGGVALVLASPQVAPDLDDAGNGRNPVDNVLVAYANVGSAKFEAHGDGLDVRCGVVDLEEDGLGRGNAQLGIVVEERASGKRGRFDVADDIGVLASILATGNDAVHRLVAASQQLLRGIDLADGGRGEPVRHCP